MRRGFEDPRLDRREREALERMARQARADVLRVTTLAGSGHVGGALSSLDIFLMLFAAARLDPRDPEMACRDRIVISHGHTAAGVYVALEHTGFLEKGRTAGGFRRPGSVFEGHVSADVPGMEWTCGNLGQGLSVGCGMALACRFTGRDYRVYVVMGDGEQQKGQIAEARRFAAHYNLANLTAVVDCNRLQATGAARDIMRQDIAGEYRGGGWEVQETDGHDFDQLYGALHRCRLARSPTVVIAHTVMGKGVPSIENSHLYHGAVLSREECDRALDAMALEHESDADVEPEGLVPPAPPANREIEADEPIEQRVQPGVPRTHRVGRNVANRTAFGDALADLAQVNVAAGIPLVAVDCDLAPSVGTGALAAVLPERLVQCGIQEHHAASLAGGLSCAGVLVFFADFAVFAIAEAYNQQRLNDINAAPVKLICTHCGLDVGPDGKTHQSVDYIGLVASMFGWKLVVPADANQTDRAVRWMATTAGNIALAMGRSKLPVLAASDGTPRFGGSYEFEYGKADCLHHGESGTIVTCGSLVHKAVEASRQLRSSGVDVGVLNVSCPLQLDHEALARAAGTGLVVTYEDHNVRTGLGSLVGTFLSEHGLSCRFLRLGVTRYGGSADREDLYSSQGLDVESLTQVVKNLCEEG